LLSEGAQIGAWRVTSLLGQGGLAVVWRVVHARTGAVRALKVLTAPDAGHSARLLREARAQAGLSHPNVVDVEDVLEVAGQPALLMALVEGPSLAGLLSAGLLPLPEALALFEGVLAGVEAAHGSGVVHRDLKPANVLLDPRAGGGWTPRVADFGLARQLSAEAVQALTATGAVLGTPAYMAPEQARDPSGVDARADIFSLGAVLFELACGRPPFSGVDLLAVIARAAAGDFPDPASLRPDLPASVRAAICGALAPDPGDRVPDCDTLRAVLSGERAWAASALDPGAAATSAPAASPPAVAPRVRGEVAGAGGSFVGRELELGRLAVLLGRGRLVTLMGPGGRVRPAWLRSSPGRRSTARGASRR